MSKNLEPKIPKLCRKERDAEKIFKLEKNVILIGRHPRNDVLLTDPKVSHKHALIIKLDEEIYEIRDLASKNQVRVNGNIVSYHRLSDGDEIKLGDTILHFKLETYAETDKIKFVDKADYQDEEMFPLAEEQKTQFLSLESYKNKDFTSLQKDHQRLMLLYEIGNRIAAQYEDLNQLLDEVLTAVLKILEAKRGMIALVDEEKDDLYCEVLLNQEVQDELKEFQVSRTIVHKVFSEGVSLLLSNAMKEELFRNVKSVVISGIKSAMCVPLQNKGKSLGVIYLDNRLTPGVFSEDDLAFLTVVGCQAGAAVQNARLLKEVFRENLQLKETLAKEIKIIGNSRQIIDIQQKIRKIAASNTTVLITGESGTGKELAAKNIHTLSPRADKPLIMLNCAAIPDTMIESELFGHERGAFTGAKEFKKGFFELAHTGTIFLDEVGNLSANAQMKVLRVLQEKEFTRVGGTKNIKVDVRIITATNKDLKQAILKGDFREDLYYRLNVIELELPPLRERKEDIIPLALHFAAGKVEKIADKAKQVLSNYEWPGNVRELQNCIESAAILGDGKIIYPVDLPPSIQKRGMAIPAPFSSLKEVEKNHIIKVMRSTGWHKLNSAEILGVSRTTLDKKIEDYKIQQTDYQ